METLKARRQEAALQFDTAEQPPAESCRIVLRFPDGHRIERTFDADTCIGTLYAWADVCGELQGFHGGKRFDVPEEFCLSTTYPRMTLADNSQTLRSLHLLPSSALVLRP